MNVNIDTQFKTDLQTMGVNLKFNVLKRLICRLYTFVTSMVEETWWKKPLMVIKLNWMFIDSQIHCLIFIKLICQPSTTLYKEL